MGKLGKFSSKFYALNIMYSSISAPYWSPLLKKNKSEPLLHFDGFKVIIYYLENLGYMQCSSVGFRCLKHFNELDLVFLHYKYIHAYHLIPINYNWTPL